MVLPAWAYRVWTKLSLCSIRLYTHALYLFRISYYLSCLPRKWRYSAGQKQNKPSNWNFSFIIKPYAIHLHVRMSPRGVAGRPPLHGPDCLLCISRCLNVTPDAGECISTFLVPGLLTSSCELVWCLSVKPLEKIHNTSLPITYTDATGYVYTQ